MANESGTGSMGDDAAVGEKTLNELMKEWGDSFYVKLLDYERKKTNGETAINNLEFTPEEMKQKLKNWVGKKINLRHDLKGGFGKITAAWLNDNGETHVRLSPGTSQAGKDSANKIKNGEITSVSPGWRVLGDKKREEIYDKDPDHVALTNMPVYEGNIIYAMASGDYGISPDENGVLRTSGGLAVLPLDDVPDAAVVVEKKIKPDKEKREAPLTEREKTLLAQLADADNKYKAERIQRELKEYKEKKNSKVLHGKPQLPEKTAPTSNETLWKNLFGFNPANNTKQGAAVSGDSPNRATQQKAKKPSFDFLSMASTDPSAASSAAPTQLDQGAQQSSQTQTPDSSGAPPNSRDYAGTNASTRMMDQIFGGVKGQPRDELGRFARRAINAPHSGSESAGASLTHGGPSHPTTSHGGPGHTATPQQQQQQQQNTPASTPPTSGGAPNLGGAAQRGLSPATDALQKTLNTSGPVQVDADEFRKFSSLEAQNKQLAQRLEELEREKVEYDEVKRAAGTRDTAALKRFVEDQSGTKAKEESQAINEVVKFYEELAEKVTPEYKNYITTTMNRLKDLSQNKEELLSEEYKEGSKPVIASVVAASFDANNRVSEAERKAEDWKNKFEATRAELIRTQEHLQVLERGNLAATSWSVHASRDAGYTPSSSSSSFSASSTPRNSLFSASSNPNSSSSSSSFSSNPDSRVSFSSSSMFSGSSSIPSASSGTSSVPQSTGASSASNQSIPQMDKQHQQGNFSASYSQHQSLEFDTPIQAFQGLIDPRFIKAQELSKKRGVSAQGETQAISKKMKKNLDAMRQDSNVIPEDPRMWKSTLGGGRGSVNIPMYGNTMFV